MFVKVKLLDTIEKLDRVDYELTYGNEITWTCVLSDGTQHKLRPDGNQHPVAYDDRLDYCDQVKRVRLAECDKQVNKEFALKC